MYGHTTTHCPTTSTEYYHMTRMNIDQHLEQMARATWREEIALKSTRRQPQNQNSQAVPALSRTVLSKRSPLILSGLQCPRDRSFRSAAQNEQRSADIYSIQMQRVLT